MTKRSVIQSVCIVFLLAANLALPFAQEEGPCRDCEDYQICNPQSVCHTVEVCAFNDDGYPNCSSGASYSTTWNEAAEGGLAPCVHSPEMFRCNLD